MIAIDYDWRQRKSVVCCSVLCCGSLPADAEDVYDVLAVPGW